MRAGRWVAVVGFVRFLCVAAPPPSAWVPVRWPWADTRSLELLAGTPVNCLLLKSPTPQLVAAVQARGVVALAVVTPGGEGHEVDGALAAKVDGIVLEGEFPEGTAAGISANHSGVAVIELTSRNRLPLGSAAPVLGTYQGVWPGIAADDGGVKKSGPTASVWIDTNTGFLRAVRAWGNADVWIANQPPPKTAVAATRYLQVVADAGISGARWVVAFDDDLAGRLAAREEAALGVWKRISGLLAYFEQHPEWRAMRESGKLAVVQDPGKGGLLSGGILDMIAVKHTPVRPIPRQQLSAEALAGATMAVNVDAAALTAERKEILRAFTRGGGTLLTGPPGWKDPTASAGSITLEKAELDRLNDIWRDVNSMIGRRNMGVRLFNVASMLSNYLAAPGGKTAIVHLVNYSDYPVENVAMHYLGEYKHATLITPGGADKSLEVYKTEEGWGVDVDRVGICATIRLEL
ncbi:MAG: hypothetical protein NTW28_22235 [Candidatus Solibacter sp.]|nr:hypothetical protein [Candidatus Solibacter sp.]